MCLYRISIRITINPKIFDLRKRGYDVTFIISKDVKKYRKRTLREPYELVNWNESYQIGEISVDTYESTDEGCAFLVRAEGRDIYHAGDLQLVALDRRAGRGECSYEDGIYPANR